MAPKDFLDITSLSTGTITSLLDQAAPFKDLFTRSVKKVPALKGKTVLMLFYEPSTRTLSSFEVAAKRLGADVTNFDVPHSSVTKGESVRDTISTLQAMRADYIVVRHKMSGQPAAIARQTRASVVNAGDGAHAHPTQALLDAFTFREVHPEMTGKKILIMGDILHSRVARSTTEIFRKLGV
ncbi:MAG: aspartate/ornithine carbamoyltransferase family protein, partial [Verrucomicrobiales bacterium]